MDCYKKFAVSGGVHQGNLTASFASGSSMVFLRRLETTMNAGVMKNVIHLCVDLRHKIECGETCEKKPSQILRIGE